MKHQDVITSFQDRPFFESRELDVLFDEPPRQVQARLSRWVAEDKLIRLRRGKYLLPEIYHRNPVSQGYISNYLYRPSYVSLFTALDLYGLIPEAVVGTDAVTTRQTAWWSTPAGEFRYVTVKKERFWGYTMFGPRQTPNIIQEVFLLAKPEKALLDTFYILKGEWTTPRLEEMRLQNLDRIDNETVKSYAVRFDSPKVSRAVEKLLKIKSEGIL